MKKIVKTLAYPYPNQQKRYVFLISVYVHSTKLEKRAVHVLPVARELGERREG
jgi:hypothetical protein